MNMKCFKTLLFASMASLTAVAQTAPVNSNATPEAKQLLETIYNQRGKGTQNFVTRKISRTFLQKFYFFSYFSDFINSVI